MEKLPLAAIFAVLSSLIGVPNLSSTPSRARPEAQFSPVYVKAIAFAEQGQNQDVRTIDDIFKPATSSLHYGDETTDGIIVTVTTTICVPVVTASLCNTNGGFCSITIGTNCNLPTESAQCTQDMACTGNAGSSCTSGTCTNNTDCTSGSCTAGAACTGGGNCTSGSLCTASANCSSGQCTAGLSCTGNANCTQGARVPEAARVRVGTIAPETRIALVGSTVQQHPATTPDALRPVAARQATPAPPAPTVLIQPCARRQVVQTVLYAPMERSAHSARVAPPVISLAPVRLDVQQETCVPTAPTALKAMDARTATCARKKRAAPRAFFVQMAGIALTARIVRVAKRAAPAMTAQTEMGARAVPVALQLPIAAAAKAAPAAPFVLRDHTALTEPLAQRALNVLKAPIARTVPTARRIVATTTDAKSLAPPWPSRHHGHLAHGSLQLRKEGCHASYQISIDARPIGVVTADQNRRVEF